MLTLYYGYVNICQFKILYTDSLDYPLSNELFHLEITKLINFLYILFFISDTSCLFCGWFFFPFGGDVWHNATSFFRNLSSTADVPHIVPQVPIEAVGGQN